MQILVHVLIGLVFMIIGIGLFLVVEVNSMSDKERAKWGHGPKGQR